MSNSNDNTNKPSDSSVNAATDTDKTEPNSSQTNYEEEQRDTTHNENDLGAKTGAPAHIDPSHPGYIAYINRIFNKL